MVMRVETTFSFDPVKEYRQIEEFSKKHPDYKRFEVSTIATVFVKTERIFGELFDWDQEVQE